MNESSNQDLTCVGQLVGKISPNRPQRPSVRAPRRAIPPVCLLLTGLALALTLAPTRAEDGQPDDWQLRRLLSPTPGEQAGEQRGRVFIYDGLDRQDVKRAMDEHFGRIESMMFIRTRIPSPSEPEETQVEEDGC